MLIVSYPDFHAGCYLWLAYITFETLTLIDAYEGLDNRGIYDRRVMVFYILSWMHLIDGVNLKNLSLEQIRQNFNFCKSRARFI